MIAIGNGESRTHINIDKLTGVKIGCNAILRDYTVDHLICVDRRMMDEAIKIGINVSTRLYTRLEWYERYKSFLHVRTVPELPYEGNQRWDEPFQWGSGPYAVLLAAKMCENKEVKILGFDLYSKTNTINNIYKDTENYDSSVKKPVDPRYWIHQIGMVFSYFPNVLFKIYQEPDWQLPQAWNQPNVGLDKISNIS